MLIIAEDGTGVLDSPRVMAYKTESIGQTLPPTGGATRHLKRAASTLGIIAIACAVRWLLRDVERFDGSFAIPLAAVACCSMIGGLVSGLVATVTLSAVEWTFFHVATSWMPPPVNAVFLFEAGVLMSVVSGQFHGAQRRARVSDAATLDLERKVLEISDEERRRIGHDLHDGLGQHLTGISLLSTSLAHRIAPTAPEASKDAERISELVTQSIGWTRDLARGLSPVTLETQGLYAALEELTLNARSLLQIRCDLHCDGEEPDVEPQLAIHVFRIIQEAVSNSVKHGKSSYVRIELDVTGSGLVARVIDDGCGLSAKTRANPGLGLRIMNYRARMIGATLAFDRILASGDRSAATSGTIVTVRCPLPSPSPVPSH